MNNRLDISIIEDLVPAIQNLISSEEHAQHSFFESDNPKWLDLSNELRKIRTRWMGVSLNNELSTSLQFFKDAGKILGFFYLISEEKNNSERNECWCISKHLLSASMRAGEVGTKLLEIEKEGNKETIITKGYNRIKEFVGG